MPWENAMGERRGTGRSGGRSRWLDYRSASATGGIQMRQRPKLLDQEHWDDCMTSITKVAHAIGKVVVLIDR